MHSLDENVSGGRIHENANFQQVQDRTLDRAREFSNPEWCEALAMRRVIRLDRALISLRQKGAAMGRANFSRATAEFQRAVDTGDDFASRTLERLERIILDHTPCSAKEAVAMLDVLIPDVSAGGRSDGRDVKALFSIRTMLDQA